MLEQLVFVGVIVTVATIWRAVVNRRRRRQESSRPGYIALRRVPPGNNGYPSYYTYEMRRASRHRRA